jgi:hypothetical protein
MRPARIYLFAVETAVALSLTRLAASLPFRWLMLRQQTVLMSPLPVDSLPHDPRARAVRRMIHRVGRRLPWKTTCLIDALAARALLRRRGVPSILHFGMTRKDGALTAHAWLETGDGVVCGGGEADRFVHLGGFSAKAPSA